MACYPPEVVRICRLSGVERSLREDHLMTLHGVHQFLQQVIRDGESAANSHDMFKALELGARAVLMTCDIMIVGLEAVTGGAGSVVSKVYDGSKLVIDAALTGSIDEKTGWTMLAKNKAKITELTLKGAQSATANKYGRVLEKTMQLVSLAEAMWGFVSGATAETGGASGIRSQTRSAKSQLDRIQLKIRAIEEELDNCEPDEALLPLKSLG